jgi:8-hydroxy-5-deazaflavin:NADPH oxidoreductase
MKLAVFGTGTVGDTIGSKLIELGHEVIMGSRTSGNEKAKAFVAKHNGKASAGTYAEAAPFGEMIFNCTAGVGSLEAMKMATVNTNSLGEEIQKAFPQTKVVKALNTMWCGLMVNPGMINGGDHNTFLSGNDAGAKEEVKKILKSFGWDENNILDLGDISTARGTEMYLALWVRIYGATNNGAFNIKIVKL